MKKYEFNNSINMLEIDPRFLLDGFVYAEDNNIDSLRIIAMSDSGKEMSLDFSEITHLENNNIIEIQIYDNFKAKHVDIDFIYSLKNLKTLVIVNKNVKVDFTKLHQLEEVGIYSTREDNLSNLKFLKKLLIVSRKDIDCQFLSQLESLEELRISTNSLLTLHGIETLDKLNKLTIRNCTKLENITSIGLLKRIDELYVEACNKIADYSFLKDNKTIKKLFIAQLDSLDFIPSMSSLEDFKFWNLKDGNINPALESNSLKKVYFTPNKKYYTHTQKEIEVLMQN